MPEVVAHVIGSPLPLTLLFIVRLQSHGHGCSPGDDPFMNAHGQNTLRGSSLLMQDFERMRPLIAQETGDAPEHAQRLDGAGGFSLAHVGRFPTELVEDAAHFLFRCLVVAANEHGRLAPP